MNKLMISKSVIMKLNESQMKQFIGGLADIPGTSCNRHTCNSKPDAMSCDKASCSCPDLNK